MGCSSGDFNIEVNLVLYDITCFKKSFKEFAENHERKYGHHHAWLYPSAKSTAYHTRPPYGGLF